MDFLFGIARQAPIAKHPFPGVDVFSRALTHPEFGALKEDRLVIRKQHINIRPEAVIARLANTVDY
jgi:hypothetical protein